jgi:hypothetical protein
MALMVGELYDALLEAGASEEKARKAAEAAAQVDTRFQAIETSLTRIEVHLESLNRRVTLLLTLIIVVLGGVLSTLWMLARR